MRLVCPNCAAQYEVDDTVIPPSGRDVQCSNCGHAWFQPGAYQDALTDDADTPDDLDEIAASDGADNALIETVAQQAAEDGDDLYANDLVPEHGDAPQPDIGAGGVMPPLSERRTLDPAMLDMLREEAERETEARRSEGTSSLEMQPELALPEVDVSAVVAAAAQPSAAARDDDVALIRSDDTDMAGDEAAVRGPRRGLLPDIEEINSTLAASSGRSHGGEAVVTADAICRRRSGFRLGFSLSLMVAAGLLALYLFAPSIAARVPALGPALQHYVDGVNGVRLWIDDTMKSSTEALRDTTPGAAAGTATN